jgi:DNA polymerase alpha subunit A
VSFDEVARVSHAVELMPEEVSVMDVHREFDTLRRKHGVEGGFGMKKVIRKYAFEQPNVPRGEADWYKVVYGFDRE